MGLLSGIQVGREGNQIEISHLFLTNDTLIFSQPDVGMILNLKCVLLCFQVVSGLNVNISKFEIVVFGDRINDGRLTGVLGCKLAKLANRYLGIPLVQNIRMGVYGIPTIAMFERRLIVWKRNFLSRGQAHAHQQHSV